MCNSFYSVCYMWDNDEGVNNRICYVQNDFMQFSVNANGFD